MLQTFTKSRDAGDLTNSKVYKNVYTTFVKFRKTLDNLQILQIAKDCVIHIYERLPSF